jgi:methionyl-tRNA formyltransferase
MGTPAFAGVALRGLLDSAHEVVCVVSQPDRPVGRGRKIRSPDVAVIAKEAALPLLQPESVGKRVFREELASYAPDVAVVAAYGQIFGPKLLALPRLGCLNIHASLLPRWRGAAPIQAAILAGDEMSGVTIMQMAQGLDSGPMLMDRALPIASTDTAQSLHDRLASLGCDLIVEALDALEKGELRPTEQPEAQVTHCPKLVKSDGFINFSESAVKTQRRIRALHPWPGSYTFHRGERLKLHPPVRVVEHLTHSGQAGKVLSVSNKALLIGTSDGVLELTRIQRAGRPAVDVGAFLAGRPIEEGERFGEEP